MRHYGLRAPTEQREQVVDQSALRGSAGDGGLENVEVTDLLDAAHGLLCFQSVNGCLNRRIGWPAFFGKRLLNLPDGNLSLTPQRVHDLKFELCQFGFRHFLHLLHTYVMLLHEYVCQGFSSGRSSVNFGSSTG